MDMQAIKDEVILKLTGDIVNFELSDSSLTKIINSSLRELQRYIDTFAPELCKQAQEEHDKC